MNLARYRWSNRLLLVFAPSAESVEYAEQQRLLEGSGPGFEERDLLTRTFFEDGSGEAVEAREAFGVGEEEFAAILVGKDGGEKVRYSEPVTLGELFGRIDAMPIRQREMHERGSGPV